MEKKLNTRILGIMALVLIALIITSCNRGTGCPNIGTILPIF